MTRAATQPRTPGTAPHTAPDPMLWDHMDKHARACAEFDARHPQVYELFRKLVLEARAAGVTKIGAKAVAERLRWEYQREIKRGDFAINNNYTALWARRLAAEHEECATMFKFRERKSGGAS